MSAHQDHKNIYDSLQLAGDRPQIQLMRLLNDNAIPEQEKSLEDALSLEFELAVYDFDAAPAYDAISYAWGEAKPTRKILVQGVELKVGGNCHYALRQARLQNAKYIWVDVLCINQQDLDEKGKQVAMMYSVYNEARRVLACIGPADEASDRILANIPSFAFVDTGPSQDAMEALSPGKVWKNWCGSGRIAIVAVMPWVSDHQPCRCSYETSPIYKHSKFRTQFCKDLNALLQRPYFQRLWVAQEIHGGGVDCLFLVGGTSFSILDLKCIYIAALVIIRGLSGLWGRPVSAMLDMLLVQAEPQENADGTKPYLQSVQHLLCSDARDRIYGTLGIDSYNLKAVKVPSYKQSAFDLVLELSRVKRFNFQGLQNTVEALAITFHHPRMASYLAGHDLACPAGLKEVANWRVRFAIRRVVDGREPLKLQDVLKTQKSNGPNLSCEKDEPFETADTNDRLRFESQCDWLLQEKQVIKGVAGSRNLRDEWVVPAATRIGDIIFSAQERSTDGPRPTDRAAKTVEDLALVVRIDDETCTIVGFATCIPGSGSAFMSETTLEQWRDLSWLSHVDVWFSATTEAMMPLAIPQRDGLLHARHAFKVQGAHVLPRESHCRSSETLRLVLDGERWIWGHEWWRVHEQLC
ncbi:unnamed protein product [Cercospora beticola]|nr:unnamed protein product [Cercospora beticola]